MKKNIQHFTALLMKYSLFLFLPFLMSTCKSPDKMDNKSTGYDPICQDVIIKDNVYPSISNKVVKSGSDSIKILEYNPTGKGNHPTLILFHGYTGMTGNIDVGTTLCRAGWNVIFFHYRGSWGMPGVFSFQNCLEDAINVVNYCRKNADSMHIDTSKIAIFGHSMGGWVALKAAGNLPYVKKVFLLSTWDIYKDVADVTKKKTIGPYIKRADSYFELKLPSGKALYEAVLADPTHFMLEHDGQKLRNKRLFFLDETKDNKYITDSLRKYTKSLEYEVWKSDHSFTYTRIAMLRKLIAFLGE